MFFHLRMALSSQPTAVSRFRTLSKPSVEIQLYNLKLKSYYVQFYVQFNVLNTLLRVMFFAITFAIFYQPADSLF